MSRVSDIILVTDGGCNDEVEIAEKLNAYFVLNDSYLAHPFVEANDSSLPGHWYAGDKGLECSIYIGAFNHFDTAEFVKYCRDLDWGEHGYVQLFVREQDADGFSLIDIRRWF